MQSLYIRAYQTFFVCLIFSSVVVGCGRSTTPEEPNTSQYGTLGFELNFKQNATAHPPALTKQRTKEPDICDDYLIETVEVELFRSYNNSLVASQAWDCAAHGGTIANVPARLSLYLICKGYVAGKVQWQGEARDISVQAGETKNIGVIVMDYTGGDQMPPGIHASYPLANAIAVDVKTSISVTFNEPLAPASISSQAITVLIGNEPVPGQVNYDANSYTIVFIPDYGLSHNTTYTVTLKPAISDTAGNLFNKEYTWTFTTTDILEDTIAPQVIFTVPSAGAAHITPGAMIQATFNEPMDPDAFNNTVFTVTSDQEPVTGQIQYDVQTRTVSLTPDAALDPASFYMAAISTDAQDLAGNPMAALYTWQFPNHRLSIHKNGTGSGTVSSLPAAIDCGDICAAGFWPGTTITLTAVAAEDSLFEGWSGGGCTGTGACALSINADTTVTANFNKLYTLSVTASPGGSIDPGTMLVKPGASQSFEIKADEGYYLAELTVDGNMVENPTLPYSLADITADHTIHAKFQPVIYVDGSKASSGNGLTWDTALKTIQEAVDQAANSHEIWVKSGTYTHSEQININKAVAVLGGFAGTESHRNQRDWQNNTVTVDANNAYRGFFVTADATIDGITFTGMSPIGGLDSPGRGILIDHASPSIANCTFFKLKIYDGEKGGAIFASYSSPTITACTFTQNVAESEIEHTYGGAIYNENSNSSIVNCTFIENKADGGPGQDGYGGAIYNESSPSVIVNCTFLKNEAIGCGGAIYNYNSDAKIDGCRFDSNEAVGPNASDGGAIYNNSSSPTITNCLFVKNIASGEKGEGGAIHNQSSGALIDRCRFERNLASGRYAYGGAIENSNAQAVIQNSIFLDNIAKAQEYSAKGGAICNKGNQPVITNCSLAWNLATYEYQSNDAFGGGICNVDSDPVITNCILWGNLRGSEDNFISFSQIYTDSDSAPTIRYNNIHSYGVNGEGNVRKYPQFGAGFHLRTNSPIIDQGENQVAPSLDIDGESRPSGAIVDMGADEFIDADGDQMPDSWEQQHGLNPAVDEAQHDTDSDQFTNLAEYHMGTDPNSANLALDASDRGSWSSSGNHDSSDKGTQVGTDTRSYLIFDLSALPGTVTTAALRLELIGYDNPAPAVIGQIRGVKTDIDALTASGTGQNQIFTDLSGGIPYGDFRATPVDKGNTLNILLNQQAVEAINAASGSMLPIGIAIDSMFENGSNLLIFSNSNEPRKHQLILSIED